MQHLVEAEEGQTATAPNRNRLYRAARAIVLIALAVTAIIGLLHTKAARPLLVRLGGCPVQFADRENVDAIRKIAITASPVAEATSPARPALGFTLDQTTEEDVRAWSAKNKVDCDESSRLGQFFCTNVPASALGDPGLDPVKELTLAFSPGHKLVNILALRNRITVEQASVVFTVRRDRLQKDLGAPAHAGGSADPAYLNEDILRTAVVDYRYKDYECELSATTMFDKTATVREHYLSTL